MPHLDAPVPAELTAALDSDFACRCARTRDPRSTVEHTFVPAGGSG
jgi:hypothetical protein